MESKDDLFSSLLGWLFGIYLLISQIMTVVFFVEYCKKDDSILEIVFIDSVLSELKGLFWIFFVW